MGSLLLLPAAAATGVSGQYALAQEFDPGQFIQQLLTNGAEAVYAGVDEEGIPTVIYGQLGIPSEQLNLDSAMYDGCMVMGLVSTHGELLNYLIGMLGGFNFTMGPMMMPSDGYTPKQFGGGFDLNSLLEMLGTEFNLLFSLFVNVEQQTSQQRMSQILAHLQTNFGFQFDELLILRVDESTFPPEMNVTLPVDSLDVYVYRVTNDYAAVVEAVLEVMNQDGFLGVLNQTVFSEAWASGAGLVAIPDIAEVVDLISSFGGASYSPVQQPFLTSQIENLTGPVAVAAVGYIGEQVISSTSTELSVGSLIGATGDLAPLPSGMSVVLANMPNDIPIVSYTPMHANYSFYENTSQLVFWNATAFGVQSDYVIHFTAGNFPPPVTIERGFSPAQTSIGGSTQVTVTVTNEGTEVITNLNISDTGFLGYYPTLTAIGDTNKLVASLGPGESTTMTYSVEFANEGMYTFPGARLEYVYNSTDLVKSTHKQGFLVESNIGSVLMQALLDGMPYTGVAVGLVALVGVWQVVKLARGHGGKSAQTIQV